MWVRPSTPSYGSFSLDMDSSPGFGSMNSDFVALFRLGFPSAPRLLTLNLATSHDSPDRSTKSTQFRSLLAVPQLVNTGFQVLFHSPPGVLFTFPSQYSSLSVTKEYLAFGGGPPFFPPDFSCPAVLWILLGPLWIRLRGFHPFSPVFPVPFCFLPCSLFAVLTPFCFQKGLGSFRFARRYSGNHCCFLFLRLLRCFSSPSSPPWTIFFLQG